MSDKITDMYQKLVAIETDNATDAYNTNTSSITNINSSTKSTEFQKFVKKYCMSKLSSVPVPNKYYTPYSIGEFIASHKIFKYGPLRVSCKSLIEYLETSATVPVRKNALYRLAQMYKLNLLSRSATWTEVTTAGRKPYLSSDGFNELVTLIQNKTRGGIAMPISKIRLLVKQRIHNEWKKINSHHNKTLPSVSKKLLHQYAMRIVSQNVFNVHATINNKTETRATAEWSFRSTISFALCVAATHFLPEVLPSPFHRRKRDLCDKSKELWDMVEIEYSKMFKKKVNVVPVLPNLVTSTDETTLFVTSGIINEEEKLYITCKPTMEKNESVSSSSRNDYSTTLTGDSHCRGLRIVLNTTFTAGGLTSPIFVAVHGLSLDEMPKDEMVTIPVPNLVVGSDRDIYSDETGFITFVRGTDAEIQDTEQNQDILGSKEARLAKLYRNLVYYPFISKVRQSQYQHKDGNDIPDNLQVISWMDGAHAQLKLLTDEESLKREKELKITICKHSAARTGVEQAADCGPNFKLLKRLVKILDDPHSDTNPIVYHLNQIFSKMENGYSNCNDIVRLKSHKKKALIATIPNLPVATGVAYTTENVKKGFIYNGQIDAVHNSVPCYSNLLHTFRGDLTNTCLSDKESIIENFFAEMFTNGCICESTYDLNDIPKDTNSTNEVVEKPDNISLENRHRAKILSSKMQIRERRGLIDKKQMKHYESQKRVYKSEQKVIQSNIKFETKLIKMVQDTTNKNVNSVQHHDIQLRETSLVVGYHDVSQLITQEFVDSHKNNMTIVDLQSFIKVRGERALRGGKLTFFNVPKGKEQLLIHFFYVKEKTVVNPLIPTIPTPPILLEPSMHSLNV